MENNQSNNVKDNAEWKLSTLDLFCLGMVIKGAWAYESLPDYESLQASLKRLVETYPILHGRYCEKEKCVRWAESGSEMPRFEKVDCAGHSIAEDLYTLVPKYNINAFKSGKNLPFEAYLLKLDDGAALVAQGAHAVMDGYTFYHLMEQWGMLTRGETVEPMVIDQSLLPSPTALTKEETLARVIEKGWVKMGLLKVAKMIFNMVRANRIKQRVTLQVSEEELRQLREQHGAGTNAVLCSYASKELLKHTKGLRSFTIATVADLRGRVCGVPENFFGNFSQAVVVGTFDADAQPVGIEKSLLEALDPERLKEQLSLSVCASHYSLPYFFMDASNMNAPNASTFYVNNQVKLLACETSFGTGLPIKAQQADLPDMIKFWQPQSGGPIDIIYSGFASRQMGR